MTIKAIVLDIDGTLLSSKKIITQPTKEALIHAQNKGIKVILASGRPTNGMVALAKTLQMDQHAGYLVSYNGARVTDIMTNDIIFNQPIPQEVTKKILTHLEAFDVIPMINDENTMYVNDVYHNTIHLDNENSINIIQYESRGGNFLLAEKNNLADFATFPINKILVAGQIDYLTQHHQEIYAPFRNNVTGAFSAPFYFEFTDKNVDKAKALETVFKPQGILPENIIAFGDGQNDLSMLQYAGIGVAMGNAVAEVKEAADFITKSNDEHGISHALAHFLSDIY